MKSSTQNRFHNLVAKKCWSLAVLCTCSLEDVCKVIIYKYLHTFKLVNEKVYIFHLSTMGNKKIGLRVIYFT